MFDIFGLLILANAVAAGALSMYYGNTIRKKDLQIARITAQMVEAQARTLRRRITMEEQK